MTTLTTKRRVQDLFGALGLILVIVAIDITGFGIVMGVTASRHGWKASALVHALANTTAIILALALNRGQV